jgi:hypothetical protein
MAVSDENPTEAEPEPADAALRAWIVPEFRTMWAGSAEAGANPILPEGAFGFGS